MVILRANDKKMSLCADYKYYKYISFAKAQHNPKNHHVFWVYNPKNLYNFMDYRVFLYFCRYKNV